MWLFVLFWVVPYRPVPLYINITKTITQREPVSVNFSSLLYPDISRENEFLVCHLPFFGALILDALREVSGYIGNFNVSSCRVKTVLHTITKVIKRVQLKHVPSLLTQ